MIGAGSAGAVVASRLSEIKNWSILLIEAGGDENEISDVPALSGYLQLSEMDWKYQTEPPNKLSPYCLAMKENRCNWPRGKVLGGSSVLNAMVYIRGWLYSDLIASSLINFFLIKKTKQKRMHIRIFSNF